MASAAGVGGGLIRQQRHFRWIERGGIGPEVRLPPGKFELSSLLTVDPVERAQFSLVRSFAVVVRRVGVVLADGHPPDRVTEPVAAGLGVRTSRSR